MPIGSITPPLLRCSSPAGPYRDRLGFSSTARQPEKDDLLSNAPSPAVRSEGTRTGNDSPRGISNTLAYSRIQAPATVQCAWCGHQYDGTDDHLTGRVRCARCGVATTSPW